MSVPPPYGYPSPQYGYPPGPYGSPLGPNGFPPGRRPTNSLAVAALICGILVAPLGIVFGHISLYQIKRSGDEGRGMAIAGLVLGYLLTAFGVLVLIVAILATRAVVEDIRHYNPSGPGYTASPGVVEPLPEFKAPATLGSNCQYLPTPDKAAKPVDPPLMGRVPTTPATIEAEISTDRGYIGLQLDNGKAPCTVNNFASLSAQGFFDDTTCHRLTTSDTLGVLQCGDPTGTGDGGPGYRFPNEYPTNQFRLTDPAIRAPMLYPRGTLAMANAGAGTNGSQFFLVYKDSQLPPTYTVFGTIDPSGLKVLDEIAADGVADGGDDGEPTTTVTIEAVVVQ